MNNRMIVTNTGISLFVFGKAYSISKDHTNYQEIVDSAFLGEWEKIPKLVDLIANINDHISSTGISGLNIRDKYVMYKNMVLPEELSQYVLNLVKNNDSLVPIVKFMDKLIANPDHNIFNQLFGFLRHGKNPLTPNGNFLAYKRVNSDYTSVHDNTTMNRIGMVVSMDRSKCNNNPEETCSSGLHFCSKDYLQHFSGERILVLEVDPSNVVSIPVDYNNTKGRACEYTIVGELTDDELSTVNSTDTLKIATVDDRYSPVDGYIRSEYLAGYKEGRVKQEKTMSTPSYLQGYKDGKNHKPQKVK